jgi:hypothetical protein
MSSGWSGPFTSRCCADFSPRAATVSPHCTKDVIEESLNRGRDLFSEVGLVFFDTTSTYFEVSRDGGGQSIGRHRHSETTGPTSLRWSLAWPSMCGGVQSAAKCGRATPPTPKVNWPWTIFERRGFR